MSEELEYLVECSSRKDEKQPLIFKPINSKFSPKLDKDTLSNESSISQALAKQISKSESSKNLNIIDVFDKLEFQFIEEVKPSYKNSKFLFLSFSSCYVL